MAHRTPHDRPDPHVLREYSFLADGVRGALVGPRGDICWMCAPRWESDAVFSSLIGGVGSYSVTPAETFVWGGFYESGTLIWRSRWVTRRGVVDCREALAYPGDAHCAVILRRIEPVPAPIDVHVSLDVAAGFGAHRLERIEYHGDDVVLARSGAHYVRLSGARGVRFDGGRAGGDPIRGVLHLDRGVGHDLVVEVSDAPVADRPPNATMLWRRTEKAWRDAVPAAGGTLADHDVTASRAVLRGMTDPGGGMVAAATMSLPERAEQGRNYDYRYVWIRDQCLAGQAAAALGATDLLDAAISFAGARLRADGAGLRPACTTTGSPVPDEHRIEIAGYPGGFDIAGNHVNAQFQLDTFGEALLLFAAGERAGRMDAAGWHAAEIAADAIARRWCDQEAGIWELDDATWTESRLICATGLRAMAAAGGPAPLRTRWESLADTIAADTVRRCVGPGGGWQRGPGDARPDASLLLPIVRGWPVDDPHAIATIRAVEHDLTDDLFVYRFRQQPGPLASAEGAFLLCGFAMALAQGRLADRVRAARYFERNRTACGPPGLFSEEYDVQQRQMRGNLPQAFVHAMFIESAARLAEP